MTLLERFTNIFTSASLHEAAKQNTEAASDLKRTMSKLSNNEKALVELDHIMNEGARNNG